MDYGNILKNVNRHISLKKSEENYFTSLLIPREIEAKNLILVENKSCKHINYVHEGVFRAYSHDHEGKERTIMFAVNDWWITDIHGFFMEKPALMSVEAIENSVIFQLRKTDLEKLFVEVSRFERFFRILMQNSYIREQLRTRQNLTMQTEERYNAFVTKYPQFISRIPLKYIASYLGVTPQFLSVVRARKPL